MNASDQPIIIFGHMNRFSSKVNYNRLAMEQKNTEINLKPISRMAVIVIAAYIGVQMVADISSLQIVSIFGLALDAGTFIYPFSFTLRDLAHKTLGKRQTQTLIIAAAGINLFMAAYFYFVSVLPIDVTAGSSEIWADVLTPVWRITIASIIAEIFSELLDTEIYSWWVEKVTKKHLWARVFISNAFSVPLDSILFSFIAFYGVMPTSAVWEIFFGNIIIKYAVTLISVPLIYAGKEAGNQP